MGHTMFPRVGVVIGSACPEVFSFDPPDEICPLPFVLEARRPLGGNSWTIYARLAWRDCNVFNNMNPSLCHLRAGYKTLRDALTVRFNSIMNEFVDMARVFHAGLESGITIYPRSDRLIFSALLAVSRLGFSPRISVEEGEPSSMRVERGYLIVKSMATTRKYNYTILGKGDLPRNNMRKTKLKMEESVAIRKIIDKLIEKNNFSALSNS